ncbi:hypothetical protein C1I97_29000 [Streptomyces sp. NTH33]|uniref:DUF6412 domain-containing protein n=1 Tax=Streptomyces sp. NTH33 TaxID=1735453 RepID=UPI000DA8AA82|nr:DUF6412 domain-containing protein [Streptomyces sp. NTH33]PZG93261.1 hypothetical protein C1I97_29000 [Streptomyces sp. NTH33]
MRGRGVGVIRGRVGPRSFVALLPLLLLPVVLLDTGGLFATVAVALAATAAGAALVVCAVLASRCVPAVAPTRVRTAMRDRALRTAFLPQRDPDAAGRRRPRAPGCVLPATAA